VPSDDDRSDPFEDRFGEVDETDGGDETDDGASALADALAEADDEGDAEDLARAVAAAQSDDGGAGETDDDGYDESSPAEDFGLRFGVVVAAVVVGSLFVGPLRLFDVVFGSGGLLPLAVREEVTNEPFLVAAGATLVVGVVAGFAFPLTDRRGTKEVSRGVAGLPLPGGDDYRSEMAIGLVLPSMATFALLAVLGLLVPVGEALVAGQIVQATIRLVVVAVVVAIALGASVVIIALFVVASVYFVIPSFVGVFLGAFLGELVAGAPEPPASTDTPGD